MDGDARHEQHTHARSSGSQPTGATGPAAALPAEDARSTDDAPGSPAAMAPSRSAAGKPTTGSSPAEHAPMAIRVMGDRLLCAVPTEDDRRSKAGIIIPATAKTADRRGLWATVEEVGPFVRAIERGDRVLFLPESAIEVDVRGEVYLIVRERDVHASASGEREVSPTGLYL